MTFHCEIWNYLMVLPWSFCSVSYVTCPAGTVDLPIQFFEVLLKHPTSLLSSFSCSISFCHPIHPP